MNEEGKKLAFVSFCIERCKMRWSVSGAEAAARFHRYGVEEYLFDEYEVIHTYGEPEIVDDIDRFIEVRKVAE